MPPTDDDVELIGTIYRSFLQMSSDVARDAALNWLLAKLESDRAAAAELAAYHRLRDHDRAERLTPDEDSQKV